jgi:alpha-tubulin suppressor-like RCC1 family protein
LSDQTVSCWGSNAQGALGRTLGGDASTSSQPAPVTGLSNVVQIAAGFYHACALRSDNHVLCWGGNASGQLGTNAADAGNVVLTPQDIPGIPGTIASIHAGGYFTCAHLTDKRVFCWGDAQWGNLGGTLGDAGTYLPPSQRTPVEITAVGTPDEINAGDRYTCVRAGTNVSCLGNNTFGQLGRPDASFTLNDDTAQLTLGGATAVYESEAYHACALAGGNVMCWGNNSNGQVGSADGGAKVETPNAVSGLPTIADLSAGGISTCARTTTGTVKCWGSNVSGEMALPPDAGTSFPSPVDISGVSNVVQVAAGHSTICALIQGGSVTCWGFNANGELGRAPDAGVANYVPAPVSF